MSDLQDNKLEMTLQKSGSFLLRKSRIRVQTSSKKNSAAHSSASDFRPFAFGALCSDVQNSHLCFIFKKVLSCNLLIDGRRTSNPSVSAYLLLLHALAVAWILWRAFLCMFWLHVLHAEGPIASSDLQMQIAVTISFSLFSGSVKSLCTRKTGNPYASSFTCIFIVNKNSIFAVSRIL
jgi:hypothetical protein